MLRGWPPPILDPAGPYAWPITTLTWVLLAMAAIVMAIVFASLWIALFGRKRLAAKLGGQKMIWIGGIILPVVVLTVLLVYGLALTRSLSDPISGDEPRVRITGEMWWWRVDYLGPDGSIIVRDANELHIPSGQPVVLELESSDVIHSFWVPRLSGKLDMVPGRRNLMRIEANEPGVFGGQCAEYCGGPHALMGFTVIAHAPGDYDRLIAERRRREEGALAGASSAGQQLFQSNGCAACHRIAGTAANGEAGPDLSYVGSRRRLGAGILPNNRGTLMGWIGNSQAIKPGNRMPPYNNLGGAELEQLAAYLEAQK